MHFPIEFCKTEIRKTLCLLGGLIVLWAMPIETNAESPKKKVSLAYVLQADGLAATKGEVVTQLANSDRDWIVLDVSYLGDDESRWTASEIKRIRASQPGRKVIAYISIGEAEDYRSYWKKQWENNPPDFLMEENRDWKGNYKVKFWMNSWQQLILADIDKLITQGFDGIYLDKVDIYEDFEYDKTNKDWIDNRPNPETGNTYRQDMISWVKKVALRSRMKKRPTLVIPQNAAQLLYDQSYRQTIDAIGVEDLFSDGEQKQHREEVRFRDKPLQLFAKSNKPVLCIDYSETKKLQGYVTREATQRGYSLLITDRDLQGTDIRSK